jgi:Uncharacterized protein conserved in bacteria
MTITSNKLAFTLAIILFASLIFAGTIKHETTAQSQSPANTPVVPDETSGVREALWGEDESARSDKITGSKIEKASLVPGNRNIEITVNLPAFLLTLWQDGKEVKTYGIGIGARRHPVAIGQRSATQIIYNPNWIPPDSPWVRGSHGVSPGEVIRARDPRNPLGKLKIPLGDAYLIHQAAKPSDIGRLVSHGCVRMLKADIFDLSEKIIAARDLPVSSQQIGQARITYKRQAVLLDEPIPVDINYDTIVIEGGKLHIYPDVYGRGTNSVKSLRVEFEAEGVDASKLSNRTMKKCWPA